MEIKYLTRSKSAGVLAAVSLSLALAGCGQVSSQPQNTTQPSSTSSAESGEKMNQDALLEQRDKLAEKLADSFVQGWIEDGKLHVSTTNEADLQTITDAGAVGQVVAFSNADLREGIAKIMAWQGRQEPAIRSGIYAYSLNPNTGGLTLSVDPEQRDAIETGLKKDKPAGQIPLELKEGNGLATPASTSGN